MRGPAYRRFRVRPRPGGGLTFGVRRAREPYGRIESAWQWVGSTLELTVTVPAGTQAEVMLPDGRTETAGPGVHEFACSIAFTDNPELITR